MALDVVLQTVQHRLLMTLKPWCLRQLLPALQRRVLVMHGAAVQPTPEMLTLMQPLTARASAVLHGGRSPSLSFELPPCRPWSRLTMMTMMMMAMIMRLSQPGCVQVSLQPMLGIQKRCRQRSRGGTLRCSSCSCSRPPRRRLLHRSLATPQHMRHTLEWPTMRKRARRPSPGKSKGTSREAALVRLHRQWKRRPSSLRQLSL